jgi:YtkA-like
MRTHWRVFAPLVAASLVLGACGGDTNEQGDQASESEGRGFNQSFEDAEVYPVFVSSELTVGSNRFIIGLLDSNDAPVNNPDIEVSVDFFDLAESEAEPATSETFDFVESVPGKRGVYVGNVEFPSQGEWGAEVDLSGGGVDESLRASFEVRKDSSTPSIGEAVPPSDTLTADDAENLSEISTDDNPDPKFYELSIAEALEEGEPFVVAFATPKFCTSATCGPTLDIVKDASADYPQVNYLHVEPYSNLDDPDNLTPIKAVEEWGLQSEPWVFVVDADGKLAAKYEGVLSADELRATLSELV